MFLKCSHLIWVVGQGSYAVAACENDEVDDDDDDDREQVGNNVDVNQEVG